MGKSVEFICIGEVKNNEKNEKNEKNKNEERSGREQAREKKREKAVNEGAEVPYPVVPSKKEKDRHLARFLDIFQETKNNHALRRSFTIDVTLLHVFKGYVNKETQVYSPRKHCCGRKL